MSKIFDTNLELWAKEFPVDAMRLQMGSFPSQKTKEASEEVLEWNKNSPLLYVYGIGLGASYKALKKWLREDSLRHVNLIEDDFGALHSFFKTKRATEMLLDKQISVCYIPNIQDTEGVLETLYWSSVLTTFTIAAIKSYSEKPFFEELSYKISYDTTLKNALVEEYLNFGAAFFRNFYPNILNLNGASWGNALFGKFKGVPAIICGAGPSLDKQLEGLEELKKHALIFAGGSALNGILSKNVLPHFGAGIDPNSTQKIRLSASQSASIPFFYRTRMLAEAVKKIPGKRLYISGVGGYDVADFYEKKFGLEAEFLDEGHNVVNFCTELACRMGCNPIIYVGLDLAYTDMRAYSQGVDESIVVSEEALLNPKNEEFRGIHRKDIFGKPVLTLWKWIVESDWLARFAKEHADVTFINATEGGIGIPDVQNQPLKDIKFNKTYSLQDKIKEEIEKAAMPQVTKESLQCATQELRASLTKCIALIDQLLAEINFEKTNPETTGVMSSGKAALAESDLYEEPGYLYILDIFHQVFARVQNKKISQIRLNKEAWDESVLSLKKLELQEEKLIFMRNSAVANITLIDYSFNL